MVIAFYEGEISSNVTGSTREACQGSYVLTLQNRQKTYTHYTEARGFISWQAEGDFCLLADILFYTILVETYSAYMYAYKYTGLMTFKDSHFNGGEGWLECNSVQYLTYQFLQISAGNGKPLGG